MATKRDIFYRHIPSPLEEGGFRFYYTATIADGTFGGTMTASSARRATEILHAMGASDTFLTTDRAILFRELKQYNLVEIDVAPVSSRAA
jgi:hypothetical protein